MVFKIAHFLHFSCLIGHCCYNQMPLLIESLIESSAYWQYKSCELFMFVYKRKAMLLHHAAHMSRMRTMSAVKLCNILALFGLFLATNIIILWDSDGLFRYFACMYFFMK